MVPRNLQAKLRELLRYYPVVAVTGRRQSGKTTLSRTNFPDRSYVSLDAPDVRAFALDDPRGFLAEYGGGAICDEVQHVPELLSYLQIEIDERPEPGRFLLNGSQHFGFSDPIAQTPVGRCGMLVPLPPSLDQSFCPPPCAKSQGTPCPISVDSAA